jgi:signal transduction histidine kinase
MAERVLVVDDEASVCQILRRKLQREGYDVTAVGSAERAVEEIEEREFDLVLTDVRMKEMDGIGLTRHIKTRRPDTEVILVTAVVDMESAVAALRFGAYDYITKPFNLEEIAIGAKSALEHRRLVLENREYQQELERKVAERTRQLEEKNDTLRHIQGQISHMEKLSSIGVLAASVSHEVNSPLAAIIGFSELILDRQDIDEEIRKFTGLIHQEGEKIRRLTQQLLDLSRQGKSEKEPYDLNDVVNEVLEVADHHLSRFQGVEIETHIHPEPLRCRFDRGKVQQVLMNLILNAAQAMPSGGKLTIRTSAGIGEGGQEGAGFSIQDTGEGVPKDIQERIFDPFFTTKDGGTGLGLKICADIVASHEGTMDLESEPGLGTTFRVWLPGGSLEDTHEPEAEVAGYR